MKAGYMDVLLRELCALAMNIAGSPRARVTRAEPHNGVIRYLSATASLTKTIDIRYAYLGLDASRPIKFIEDIRRLPEYDNHPIFELLPYLTSVAIYHILDDGDGQVYLSVANPEPSFFHDEHALESMERIVDLIRMLLTRFNPESSSANSGLNDSAAMPLLVEGAPVRVTLSEGAEPASKFLFDTLLQKPRLLGRNGCSYLSLRMWRKTIKPHQLAAFVAVKLSPPQSIVDKIAAEIAASVKQTFGNTFQTVVPVPGGSSGRDNAFSVVLGRSVSRLLGVSFVDALTNSDKPGSSHPKKSSKMPPFQLREKVQGTVLIVDDVATSGRHIELATQALRPGCEFCTSVVWISD
jgi:hypoxanthine-guanine phosphoribosyltransferase